MREYYILSVFSVDGDELFSVRFYCEMEAESIASQLRENGGFGDIIVDTFNEVVTMYPNDGDYLRLNYPIADDEAYPYALIIATFPN